MAVSCMGGWCRRRDECALHVTEQRERPVERLCEVGMADSFEPVRIVRKQGSWARGSGSLLAPATWLDQVVPA